MEALPSSFAAVPVPRDLHDARAQGSEVLGCYLPDAGGGAGDDDDTHGGVFGPRTSASAVRAALISTWTSLLTPTKR